MIVGAHLDGNGVDGNLRIWEKKGWRLLFGWLMILPLRKCSGLRCWIVARCLMAFLKLTRRDVSPQPSDGYFSRISSDTTA
jgi:hypothetical protein